MNPNLWNSLEALSTQAALLMEWEKELGADFQPAKAFLRPTHQQVESYPCTHPNCCGCRHRVVFESPEEVSAVCDCEEGGCEPFFLGTNNLTIYVLDGPKFAAAIRRAFHFDEIETARFEEGRSRLVGGWGIRRSRVFFNVPIGESSLLTEIDRLCASFPDPFVVLTPTSHFCTPIVQRALRRQGCAQMTLEGVLRLTASEILELVPATKGAVDAFFSDFGRQVGQGKPLELAIARVEEKLDAIAKSRSQAALESEYPPEEVARTALALARELDTTRRMKNPTMLTVFRLYCINEMSATQIAKECGCSKTAILKRLRILARKIGVPPERLRRYSAQFERLEGEMEDSRAKKIYREGLVDDAGEDAEV